MKRTFRPQPDKAMLNCFYHSEQERLAPFRERWAWRLVLFSIFTLLVGGWAAYMAWGSR